MRFDQNWFCISRNVKSVLSERVLPTVLTVIVVGCCGLFLYEAVSDQPLLQAGSVAHPEF
jgi:hypothetical protein